MNEKTKEKILCYIGKEDYIPITPSDMMKEICGKDEENSFFSTVYEMERLFYIALTKKGRIVLPKAAGIYEGEYSSSARSSFGFVSTEDGEFFIPPKFNSGAFHKDKVVIKKIEPDSKYYGKGNEAEVIFVRERAIKEICGTFRITFRKGSKVFATVTPDDQRVKIAVGVSQNDFNGAKENDKVICSITEYPKDENSLAKGSIKEVLGEAESREANYKAILLENGIITEFPDNVLKEADAASEETLSANGRLDLREKTVFTIDGADAKDLDDAISVEKTENGYKLGVHIADVSHYVKENSFLDAEAFMRGTSVYFTDKVVPMLPKQLSNGICSLNGGVDRYALSAFMELDERGNIESVQIVRSIINSKVRGVYSELNDIIKSGENSEFYVKYRHILADFRTMFSLYGVLKEKSARKGAMELESDETEIVLDEKGHPVDIIPRERGESERLIEQFMLCANEGVAEYLHNAALPCVYRVHDEPDKDKISSFALFAKNLGVDVSPLRTKQTITSMQLSSVLENSKKAGRFDIVSSVLLRSLMKARYSSVPKSHFGLATQFYCHFTSPIRRYPDLSVHRIINALLDGKIDKNTIGKYEKFASSSAEKSSENELRAVYAEREIDDLYKCIYMGDRLGNEYDATICSVASFGFFARTDNLCEGLVPIETLRGNYFFDPDNFTLSTGKRTFRLGQRIKIKVYSADVTQRRVIFVIAGEKSLEPGKTVRKQGIRGKTKATSKRSEEKNRRNRKKSDRNMYKKHRKR